MIVKLTPLGYNYAVMPKKKPNQVGKIINRRARFDYELGDSLVVGIELTGAETKSLRMGHGQLRGAYVTIKNDELFLINANITGSNGIPITETEATRSRKLLAKRKEINTLIESKKQGRTIVPTELMTRGKYIKLRIALGKGKKLYDKRQSIKAREESRRINDY
jgi:SsrA-binding protein